MRILFLTQLFQPEPNHLKGLRFATELAKMGHEVEVLTGFPNYPGGKIYSGYRQSWRFHELLNGIPVYRVPLYPSHNSSGMTRILSYMSFMMTAVIPGLFQIKRPAVVHVYQGPATLALPAMILKMLLGVPYVLDVQDLWPDSVTSSGMLNLPGTARFLDLWCRLTYRFADKIVVLSPGYKRTLMARGVDASKIEVVYNWCNEQNPTDAEVCKDLRNRYNLYGYHNVIYAGNMGPIQALNSVIDAAGLLERKGSRIRFLFVGDGVESDRLKEKARNAGLTTVQFIPRQSPETASCLIAEADAVLVHLRADDLGRIGIPQKTQAYMAAGRPIVMAMGGDAADLVRRAGAGIICEPENPDDIALAIEGLFRLSKEERERLGRNGREYYEEHLSFIVGVRRMESLFLECLSGKDD